MATKVIDWDIQIGDPQYPFGSEEGVVLKMAKGTDGLNHAAMLPSALAKASPELVVVLSELQHTAAEIQRLVGKLDDLVPEARDLGASWESIGWCVGTTGSAVRQRWSAPPAAPKSGPVKRPRRK